MTTPTRQATNESSSLTNRPQIEREEIPVTSILKLIPRVGVWAKQLVEPCLGLSRKAKLAVQGDIGQISEEEKKEWTDFFASHFNKLASSAAQDKTKNNETTDAALQSYAKELTEKVNASKHVYVSFDDLPECHSSNPSRSMSIRTSGGRKHISEALAETTLRAVNAGLREGAGTRRAVHLDLGLASGAAEAGTSDPGSSTQTRSDFTTLRFRAIANVLAHFGITDPTAEAASGEKIPGLTVSADLSGLAIKRPADVKYFSGLYRANRVNIEQAHLNMNDMSNKDDRIEAWRDIKDMLTKPNSPLTSLTLHVSPLSPDKATDDPETADQAAKDKAKLSADITEARELARAIDDPECSLNSLTLSEAIWSEQAMPEILKAMRRRQEVGRPIKVTIGDQVLDPST